MIELVKYFRILFMSVRLTNERLKGFCEDHIQRLTANNPGGIFTPILTAITNAYNSFFGDMASEAVNEAVREGKTLAMNESRTALEKLISEDEKLINYTYRNNRDVYEEFFPLGITEYQNADLATFETITLRLRTVLGNHSGDFTAAFVADYGAAQQLFVDNRGAQSTAKGNLASERSDIAATRPVLALQLTKNLLTISLQYAGDETKAAVYFDQAILDAAFRESERKVIAEINAGVTQNIFDNIIKGDLRISFKNNGEDILNFSFKDAPDAAVPAGEHTVNPGQEIIINAAEWGWSTVNKYLNVTNNGSQAGSYKVEKI